MPMEVSLNEPLLGEPATGPATEPDNNGSEKAPNRKSKGLNVLPYALLATIANFCFGYNIGVTNGPLEAICKELGFADIPILKGMVVSVFLIGAFIGSVCGGWLADLVGRRRNLQLDTVPLIIGSLLSATAHTFAQMIAGRLLTGFGVGAAAGFSVVYISEISPVQYRGAFGCLCQISTALGNLTSLLLNIPSANNDQWWRTLFWVGIIPALLLALGMQFGPESPRWLSQKGKWEEAKETLTWLMSAAEAETAMDGLRDVESTKVDQQDVSWNELLSIRYLNILFIGGMLFIFQQFCGINAILYFSTTIFQQAGISNSATVSVAIGAAVFAGAVTVVLLVDFGGRRRLLIGSHLGMAICLTIGALGMVLPIPNDISHMLSVVGTLGYVYVFSLGAGPITGMVISELANTRIRAKVMAFSLGVHWVANFLVGFLFLQMVEVFGLPSVYTGFTFFSILGAAFVFFFIEETMGKSLEQIEHSSHRVPYQ